MSIRPFLALWLLFAWLSGASSRVEAAPLSAEGKLLVTQPRLGAPEWVEIHLTSTSPSLRTGVIEWTAMGDSQIAYVYRTREITVITGKQTLRFLLPPWPAYQEALSREWRLQFLEGEHQTPLGSVVAPPPISWGRSLILAMVRGEGRTGLSPTWNQLRVENVVKIPPAAQESIRINTAPTAWEPADLPADPLGFCAFDVVVLEQQALAELPGKTRLVLRQWVHGGGSLAVIAPTSLGAADLEYLDELAAPDPKWNHLARGPDAPGLPAGKILTARANFGRLLVAREAPTVETATAWNQPLEFLWKLKSDAASFVTSTNSVIVNERYSSDRQRSTRLLEPARTLMLPRSVQMLPTSVLWIVIGLFVLAIGPADWWLLGRLRARRWTWVLFPLVAAGFTVALMKLASSSLKDEPVQRTLTITDLGNDGQVVRETQLYISFPKSTGEQTLDLEGSLVTPLPGLYQAGLPQARSAPQIAGSFPHRYRFTQSSTQWNPTALRSTSLLTAGDTSQVDWGAVQRSWKNGWLQLSNELLDDERLPSEWLFSLSTLAPKGMSRIAQTTSPSGSGLLEDLACLDPANPDQSLAVVARRTPDGLHVWRRLYLR